MPGEKLSRGSEGREALPEVDDFGPVDEQDDGFGDDANGRRRRRRRGGRGRGRGARSDEQPLADVPSTGEDEPIASEHADEVPTLPQHSGFGSVWDSQIGVPSGGERQRVAADASFDEEVEDEPEVPEYLLSEKRQGGRRRGGRNRTGGRGGGYRTALDRERFGSGSGSGYARSFGRGRGTGTGAPRASLHAMEPIEQTPAGDPWSEVPPEVQELLMAEMARREGGGKPAAPAREDAEAKPASGSRKRTTSRAASADSAAEETTAKAKPASGGTRKRTTAKAATAESAAEETTAEAKPARRTTRKRTTAKAATAESAAEETTAEAKPARRTTRKRTTAKAAEEA
jgi:hypothetical protein